jgi:hypothetical protein
MKDVHHCTKSGGKSRSGSSRRRQRRDSRPRQQKSIKAREAYIVNGLTPDFSHGLLELHYSGWSKTVLVRAGPASRGYLERR